MIVYRICKTYPPDHNPIDGLGARKHGGRWNNEGVRAVYTAESLSLARSEMARHLNLESAPDDLRVYKIEVPDYEYSVVEDLPGDWDSDPEGQATKDAGDTYLNNPNLLCFKVPSVCDPESYNIVLNPEAHGYSKVRIIDDFPFKP